MNRSRRVVLVVVLGAILAAALAATGIYVSQHSGAGNQQISVVVATQNIQAGSEITSDSVGVEQRDINTVPPNSLTDKNSAVGKFAILGIGVNTIINPSLLGSTASEAISPTTGGVPLTNGNVAISVPYDPASGIGGYLVPGDHVDILVDTTGTHTLKYAFQDVPVLKVGGITGGTTLLVVEMSRSEAKTMEELVAISDANAKAGVQGPHIVAFVLRATAQDQKGYIPTCAAGTPVSQCPYSVPSDEQAITPGQLSSLFGS